MKTFATHNRAQQATSTTQTTNIARNTTPPGHIPAWRHTIYSPNGGIICSLSPLYQFLVCICICVCVCLSAQYQDIARDLACDCRRGSAQVSPCGLYVIWHICAAFPLPLLLPFSEQAGRCEMRLDVIRYVPGAT